MGRNPEVKRVDDFNESFQRLQGDLDYLADFFYQDVKHSKMLDRMKKDLKILKFYRKN